MYKAIEKSIYCISNGFQRRLRNGVPQGSIFRPLHVHDINIMVNYCKNKFTLSLIFKRSSGSSEKVFVFMPLWQVPY